MASTDSDSGRNSPSTLESLPSEVIANIMTRSHSTADLSALIHSSPIIHARFRDSQQSILINFLQNQFCEAISDATIWSSTQMLPADRDNLSEIKVTVQLYRDLKSQKHSHNWRAILQQNPAQVDRILKMLEPLNHLVNLFKHEVRGLKRYSITDTDDAMDAPITATERSRVLIALLRYQTVINIIAGKKQPEGDEEKRMIFEELFKIWNAWEMEQIALVKEFVFISIARLADEGPIILSQADAEWLDSGGFDDPVVEDQQMRFLDSKKNERRQACFRDLAPNLGALRAQIKATALRDSSFTVRSRFSTRPSRPRFGFILDSVQFQYLDRNYNGSATGEKQLEAVVYEGETALGAPWAWVDAFDGEEATGRWGEGLCDRGHPQLRMDQIMAFEDWRSYRTIFWDKERAQRMVMPRAQQSKRKIYYKSGWLVKLWELEMENKVEMLARLRGRNRLTLAGMS